MTTLPIDPLFWRQWHLDRTATLDAAIDLNVVPVWDDYTGQGVRVAVIDRPVEADHPDLDDNYAGITFPPEGHAHGTQVAGIIAAERNGEGGVGVAYEAKLTGLGGSTSAVIDAAGYDVANISLGTLFAWDRTIDWADEYANAAENGRDGLGTIVVVASGNNRQGTLDANLSPFTAHRHTIVTGAVGKSGLVSFYSSEGATLTVVAPSSSSGTGDGITTTDLQGPSGIDLGDYSFDFGGTSAAAPMVSGVVALMLEANPGLGWRDVQEILAITARHTGTDIGQPLQGSERFAWTINAADTVNGGGFHFSNDYGFGLIDALAAVRLAETWDKQQTSTNELTASAGFTGSLAVPDASAGGVEVAFTIGDGIVAERIDLTVGLTHGDARQIEITIISPSGTESILFFHRGENPDRFGIPRGFQGWTFGSNAFAGEDAEGTWIVRVADTVAGGAGTLRHLTLNLYGEAAGADDVYYYTNEYGALAGVAHRNVLEDEAGVDTINAAAATASSRIDLRLGAASEINGHALTIAAASIENAVGGDGGDWIAGNAASNWLRGQRGDDRLAGFGAGDILDGGRGADRLNGGEGDDQLLGGDGDDRLSGGAGNDILLGGDGDADVVSYRRSIAGINVNLALAGPQNTGGAGIDSLSGVEHVQGSAHGDRLTGNAAANILWGHGGNDVLVGGAEGDRLNGGDGDDRLSGGAGANDVASYQSAATGVAVDLSVAGPQDTVGAGIDRLDGVERLQGTDFADRLTGDERANVLWGDAGNDLMFGGEGDDRLIGGEGRDVIDGGGGRDVASYATAASRVVMSLAIATPQRTGGAGSDTLSGIEGLEGSAFADSLAGDAHANVLRGLAGGDRLDGSDGDDLLDGAEGDDLLIGGAGDDVLRGGEGQLDTVVYTGSSLGVVVNLALARAQDTVGAGIDTLRGIERAKGSELDDRLTGNGAANTLWGFAGDDRLAGGEADDILAGGPGSDLLAGGDGMDVASYRGAVAGVAVDLNLEGAQATGGGGADTLSGIESVYGSGYSDALTGSAGANVLRGFEGNDVLVGGDGNDRLEGGAGDDLIAGGKGGGDVASYAGAAAGVTVDLRLVAAQDTRGSGFDALTGIERLVGSIYDDTLIGGARGDTLSGLGGGDILSGGEGNDTLRGGDGDDVLFGGTGIDTMTGGSGSDRFIFQATGEAGLVTDFADGSDRIDLTAFGPSVFVEIYSLNQFFPDDHNMYIYVDADGDGVDFQIVTVRDFLLLNPFGILAAEDLILADTLG